METLKYIRLNVQNDKAELIVQLSGGGAAIGIERHASANEVVYLLRRLAHALEKGVNEREPYTDTAQPAA